MEKGKIKEMCCTYLKICMIMPYFGRWPNWFELFMETCKHNPNIDWLFFTDCGEPENKCGNVKFVKMTLEKFRTQASKKLKLDINLKRPRKLCDIRPAYGVIFDDYLKGYDFWGHSDVDVMYGDIRKFLPDDVLANYDILTMFGREGSKRTGCYKERISGHFALYKNCEKVNRLYESTNEYREVFRTERHLIFDEKSMYRIVKNFKDIKLFAEPLSYGINYRIKSNYYWSGGKMFVDNAEIMSLHFVDWKEKNGILNKAKVRFKWSKASYGWRITKYGFFKLNDSFAIYLILSSWRKIVTAIRNVLRQHKR